MVDIVDKKTRSRMMSGIRGANTQPEIAVRRRLYRAGYRYRLHSSKVPGRPDIVLPRLRAVVFVHGCFWHRHPGCKYAYTPRSNFRFWKTKFADNVSRDRKVRRELAKEGWRVHVIWECQVGEKGLNVLLRKLKRLRPDRATG
jgi:DNA mismatch endonuclease (patch repair protein)